MFIKNLVCGIDKRYGDTVELNNLFLELVHELGKMDKASCQPVKLPYYNNIAFPDEILKFEKAFSLRGHTRDFVRLDVLLLDPILKKGIDLKVQVLVRGTNPCLSENHSAKV